jgi:hypothetical protein
MDKCNGSHVREAGFYSQQVWETVTATTPKSAFRSPQFTYPTGKEGVFLRWISAEAEHDKFVEFSTTYLAFSHFIHFPNYSYENISVNNVLVHF